MSISRRRSLFSVAIAAGALACDSDGPADVPSRTLEIVVVTSGDEADPDGYTVQIDAQPSRTVGASEVLQDNDITAGDHTVYVGGVAGNCTIQGANPRTVTVSAEGRTTLTIEVVCSPRLGSVLVGIRTQGPAPYPAPYTVAVDGIETAALDTGRVLLERVAPGQHLIELRNVPQQCSPHGNRFTITVRPLEVTAVAIFVVCVTPRSTLVITTLTSGSHAPNHFLFTVDGKNPTPIGPLAVLTVEVISGDHRVELLQIPTQCQVQEPNPIPVHIPVAGRGQVIFATRCGPS
jgi:hypothetical protein